MNDKILELADKCWSISSCDGDADFDYEKFAKLIISKCVFLIEETNDRYRKEYFADKIREHFGVEK